ncbi:recombinase [Solitalea longa]|uniref:Recombinase n=1 Tax=Solitalea longa TaxID=2079460 RepID=A0A2S5A054_9SPHI|nr:site-specific integrase [Solitalea longa]POY35503.1 recombinase [Solitalea longa]
MASTTVVIRSKKLDSKGEAPLYLRIIKDRKAKFISVGIKIDPKFWDEKKLRIKKGHPNSQRFNNYLTNKIAEAENIILDLQTKSKTVSPKSMKEMVIGKPAVSFGPFANKYLEHLERKNLSTYRKYKSLLKKIEAFTPTGDLYFDEIDVAWLKKYEAFLKTHYHNSHNTIYHNLKFIRRVFQEAINEDMVTIDKNPFYKFKITRQPGTREFLTEDEIKKIEEYKLTPFTKVDTHRDMFIFSAYAGGIRVSDMLQLKWENFDGERILLQTQKTGSVVSIKLPGKALEIIAKYKKGTKSAADFIFPIFNNAMDYEDKDFLFREVSTHTAYINKNLKWLAGKLNFEKKLSFHIARHTFATRALKKGMRIEYVSKLLGHSDIRTTQIYAKIVNEDLDKAMEIFNEKAAPTPTNL